jgi:uncharacterized protein (DUF1778 family)
MASERLEVRLDPEHRRKLAEVAESRGMRVSELVRRLIDESYEDVLRERRRGAARRLAELELEDVPDPEVLTRQLESTHDTPLH